MKKLFNQQRTGKGRMVLRCALISGNYAGMNQRNSDETVNIDRPEPDASLSAGMRPEKTVMVEVVFAAVCFFTVPVGDGGARADCAAVAKQSTAGVGSGVGLSLRKNLHADVSSDLGSGSGERDAESTVSFESRGLVHGARAGGERGRIVYLCRRSRAAVRGLFPNAADIFTNSNRSILLTHES